MWSRKSEKGVFWGLCVFMGLLVAGCISLGNLFNPIHAIDKNGTAINASLGANSQVKIGEGVYPYIAKPTVPRPPVKPIEPQRPTPPRWTSGPIDVETGVNNDIRHTVESFSNRDEAIRKIDFYSSKGRRNDLSALDRSHALHIASAITDSFNFYESQQKQYNSALAKYQADLTKYQQEINKYEQDNNAYKANLPNYTFEVEAKIKSIQDSINPNTPTNWIGYVEDKYLIYEGKIK